MAKKKIDAFASHIIERYKKLINTVPGIELKGATIPYTSHNGHMFTFLDKEGKLALRLPADDRQEFMQKFKTSLFQAHGTVLKEYVEVPEKILDDTRMLQAYLKKSFSYVDSLKPKATKRSK